MKLSKQLQYAIVFLQLFKKKNTWTAKEAAQTLNISALFLSRIAADLCRAGVIRGSSGHGGGYRLDTKACLLTYRMLFDLFQPLTLSKPSSVNVEHTGGLLTWTKKLESSIGYILDESVGL